jgi:hypothetical protein
MPPGPTKKAVIKAADKAVDDKTFGLKNKNKSKKVQAYVQNVKKAVAAAVQQKNAPKRTPEEMQADKLRKLKEDQAKMEKELALLFKSSMALKQPVLPPGVDPKSVLCVFFQNGVCEKGAKCKFGHDLTLARKAAKASIYVDRRAEDGAPGEKKEDTIEDWDQAKLESVVKTKHGAEAAGAARTEIVCQYFLEALEKEL